jgi:molybdopterin converting factor small subunit
MTKWSYLFFVVLFFYGTLNASVMQEGEFYKEKQEIITLKQTLSDFFKKKEQEYEKQKKELKDILAKIEINKKDIQKLKKENEKIKNEITRKVVDKTIVYYDKMKVKVALNIFKKMIKDGKFNEVFDIIIRLKQKRVLILLKKFDVPTKTKIMEKMKKYKYEEKLKKKLKKEQDNG